MCFWEGRPYLNYNCLDAGHVRPPCCMLLHVLAWRIHRHQNAGVRGDDDAAGQDVTEDEERHSVGACCRELIGEAPVNATGGAVRFRAVLPPVGQRWAGKQQGIDPSAGDEQAAMNGAKPVPCEKKASPGLTDITIIIIVVVIKIIIIIMHTSIK